MQVADEDHELTAEADSTFDLQRELYQLAIQNSSGGGVQTLFSTISPSSAVYQVPEPSFKFSTACASKPFDAAVCTGKQFVDCMQASALHCQLHRSNKF